MAGILPFLGSAFSVLQGLGQNQSVTGRLRRVDDLYGEATRNAREERARLAEVIRQLQAAGYGNADAQIAQIDRDYEAEQKIAHRNLLGAYQSLGYEPGDTPTVAAQQSLSSRGLAQQAALKANARQQAANQTLQIQDLLSPREVNAALYAQGNAIAGSPLSQQRDLSGAVMGLANADYDWLGKRAWDIR